MLHRFLRPYGIAVMSVRSLSPLNSAMTAYPWWCLIGNHFDGFRSIQALPALTY
jgi:hypothetical protein